MLGWTAALSGKARPAAVAGPVLLIEVVSTITRTSRYASFHYERCGCCTEWHAPGGTGRRDRAVGPVAHGRALVERALELRQLQGHDGRAHHQLRRLRGKRARSARRKQARA